MEQCLAQEGKIFIFFRKRRACIECKSFFFRIKITLYKARFSARRQRNVTKGMFKVQTFFLFFFSFSFLSESKSSYIIWINVQCGTKEIYQNVNKRMQFLQNVN